MSRQQLLLARFIRAVLAPFRHRCVAVSGVAKQRGRSPDEVDHAR